MIYRKMLVPLDGSQVAEVVFNYGKELAVRLGLDITLLHVSPPEEKEFVPMRRAYIEHATHTVLDESREAQVKEGVTDTKPIEVKGELVIGYPADEILRYAEENQFDLILMASHGSSGVTRWSLGSVTDKVLRASKIPIWLVHAGVPNEIVYDKWPKTTILVPLDGSELAESVLPHVEAVARQRGTSRTEIVLLRICEEPMPPAYYVPESPGATITWGNYMEREVARCQEVSQGYLEKLAEGFKGIPGSVRWEILVGKPADEIVDYANKSPFNLIIMATHGRSGLNRWVFGSVAENVLQGVTCPVLLIRPSMIGNTAKEEKEK